MSKYEPFLWNEFWGVTLCAVIGIGCLVDLLRTDNPSGWLVVIPFMGIAISAAFTRRFMQRLMRWKP